MAESEGVNDPVNPEHYNGTACAQIGERLTANCYQILEYNWRLGKKDDPVIEVAKSIWYLDREIKLAMDGFVPVGVLPSDLHFNSLLVGIDDHITYVAWRLIDWCRNRHMGSLTLLREQLVDYRANLEDAATGQTTMHI